MEKVKSKVGTPIADDFDSKDGTPIVINSTTGQAYDITDAGVITDISLTKANIASIAALTLTGNGGDVLQVNPAGTAFELSQWTRVTASQAVVQGQNYIIAGNSIVLTLPGTIIKGAPIRFLTETATQTGNSVARNGNTIMNLAEDMTIDDSSHWFWEMAGDAQNSDWRIT
jgi:hypothetical protein